VSVLKLQPTHKNHRKYHIGKAGCSALLRLNSNIHFVIEVIYLWRSSTFISAREQSFYISLLLCLLYWVNSDMTTLLNTVLTSSYNRKRCSDLVILIYIMSIIKPANLLM